MADRLAERRKRAQIAEGRAKVAAKASLEMAKDIQAVKSQSFAEGFQAGIIEAERLAWSAGTIGALRVRLSAIRHRPKEKAS